MDKPNKKKHRRERRPAFDPLIVVRAFETPKIRHFLVTADMKLVRSWLFAISDDERTHLVEVWYSENN